MSLSQEILNESELAKSYVTNSDLDENYKKTLLSLIQTTTLATNGISPEEKIQKMTEAIHLLAISQITFVSKVDDRIWHAINKANTKQCDSCKAMQFVEAETEKRAKMELFNEWEKENGGQKKHDPVQKSDTNNKFQMLYNLVYEVVTKPYFWITFCIIGFSPYGLDIIRQIIQAFK